MISEKCATFAMVWEGDNNMASAQTFKGLLFDGNKL
jgi:hypothetical protein